MRWAALLVVAGGCGRIGFDPRDPLEPFDPPLLVDVFADGDVYDPRLSPDGLELYVSWTRASSDNRDIWVATRPDLGTAWQPPVSVVELNTVADEATPELSADGLTLLFARTITGSGSDILTATRDSLGGPWTDPAPLAELNSTSGELNAFPLPDDRTMYVVSYRSGNADIHRATRADPLARWSTPAPIAELATSAIDGDMWVDDADTTMFFDSDRSGAMELYAAIRPDRDAPWGAPAPVAELVSSAQDVDPFVTEDGRTIVFASDRTGPFRIYVATRP